MLKSRCRLHFKCWSTAYNAGPKLIQHGLNNHVFWAQSDIYLPCKILTSPWLTIDVGSFWFEQCLQGWSLWRAKPRGGNCLLSKYLLYRLLVLRSCADVISGVIPVSMRGARSRWLIRFDRVSSPEKCSVTSLANPRHLSVYVCLTLVTLKKLEPWRLKSVFLLNLKSS